MKKGSKQETKLVPCRSERKLWAAVVEKAVEDATKGTRDLREDGLSYIFDNDRRQYSFLWCCEALELSASAVREDLVRRGVA